MEEPFSKRGDPSRVLKRRGLLSSNQRMVASSGLWRGGALGGPLMSCLSSLVIWDSLSLCSCRVRLGLRYKMAGFPPAFRRVQHQSDTRHMTMSLLLSWSSQGPNKPDCHRNSVPPVLSCSFRRPFWQARSPPVECVPPRQAVCSLVWDLWK